MKGKVRLQVGGYDERFSLHELPQKVFLSS